MKILVASALIAGSHIANAINTVKMAEGFARLGHTVTVVCRRDWKKHSTKEKLHGSYGITSDIEWIQLPFAPGGNWGFALPSMIALLKSKPDLVFTRNYIFPALTARWGIPTIAESHAHVGNMTRPFMRMVHATRRKEFLKLITISRYLANNYQTLGVPPDKLLVLPDSVDTKLFERPQQMPDSPYSERGINIVYAGHLYDYKGIPVILETAKKMPDLKFHLVGGLDEDIERQRNCALSLGITNVVFYGMLPHSAVPPYLWHADVLLLVPSLKHPSAKWTSPVKLGEYLMSGTPVVASHITALRDWLTDEEVEFVCPDDADALAAGIRRVLSDKKRASAMVQRGLQMAEMLSYENRASQILQSVKI